MIAESCWELHLRVLEYLLLPVQARQLSASLPSPCLRLLKRKKRS